MPSATASLRLCARGRAAARRLRCSAAVTALGGPRPAAVLLDAYGVILHLAEPVEVTYLRHAQAYGVRGLQLDSVRARWKAAWLAHQPAAGPRYVGDGADFWRRVVAESTGCSDAALFARVFAHFSLPQAWVVADGAERFLCSAAACGYKLGLVSNFDTRLRPLLHELRLAQHFGALVVSAEEGVEKPDGRLFELAAARLNVPLAECLHVGDDEANDVQGARAAGARALHFGRDVASFAELQALLCAAD